jgi:GTP-binding protein EngB required for normal cell division
VGQRIARVSATPGKTRALNVYEVQLGSGERGAVADGADRSASPDRLGPLPALRSLYLLDLPGYGYARASKPDLAAFAKIVRHVLQRPRLSGVVWLLDIRHEPSERDRTMQDLLAGAETRVLVAATKADKLSRAQQRQREGGLRQALALDEDQIVITSAQTGLGMPELREAIAALARAA